MTYVLVQNTCEKKRRNKIARTYSRGICWQEVIGMNHFDKEAGINNPEIAR